MKRGTGANTSIQSYNLYLPLFCNQFLVVLLILCLCFPPSQLPYLSLFPPLSPSSSPCLLAAKYRIILLNQCLGPENSFLDSELMGNSIQFCIIKCKLILTTRHFVITLEIFIKLKGFCSFSSFVFKPLLFSFCKWCDLLVVIQPFYIINYVLCCLSRPCILLINFIS